VRKSVPRERPRRLSARNRRACALRAASRRPGARDVRLSGQAPRPPFLRPHGGALPFPSRFRDISAPCSRFSGRLSLPSPAYERRSRRSPGAAASRRRGARDAHPPSARPVWLLADSHLGSYGRAGRGPRRRRRGSLIASAGRRSRRSSGASEIPGADSIFSRRCGGFPGRLSLPSPAYERRSRRSTGAAASRRRGARDAHPARARPVWLLADSHLGSYGRAHPRTAHFPFRRHREAPEGRRGEPGAVCGALEARRRPAPGRHWPCPLDRHVAPRAPRDDGPRPPDQESGGASCDDGAGQVLSFVKQQSVGPPCARRSSRARVAAPCHSRAGFETFQHLAVDFPGGRIQGRRISLSVVIARRPKGDAASRGRNSSPAAPGSLRFARDDGVPTQIPQRPDRPARFLTFQRIAVDSTGECSPVAPKDGVPALVRSFPMSNSRRLGPSRTKPTLLRRRSQRSYRYHCF